jgi:O-antigen/teichoic acid export membrane protein
MQGEASFTWLRVIVPGGYLVGTVALIVGGHLDVLTIVLLHLVLNVVTLAAILLALARGGIPLRGRPDPGLARQMLTYGATIHVGTIAALTTMHLDQVLMAAWLPPHDLGLYVVAVSAAGVTYLVAQTVQLAVTPSIMPRSSAAERAGALQAVFRRYVILSLLLTLVLGALLPVAIPLVFGRAFEGAVRPAEVLLVGAFFFGANIVLAGGAQALGTPWIGSRAQIGGLMATVVLLPLLLPTLGIVGAALASTGAWVTTFTIVTAVLCRTHGIPVTDLVRITSRDVISLLDVRAVLKG